MIFSRKYRIMIKRGENMILTNDIIKSNLQEYSNKNTKICRKVKNWNLIKIINGLYETDPNINGFLQRLEKFGRSK